MTWTRLPGWISNLYQRDRAKSSTYWLLAKLTTPPFAWIGSAQGQDSFGSLTTMHGPSAVSPSDVQISSGVVAER